MLGVRIPAAADLSRKTGSDSHISKLLAIGVSVTGPRNGHYKEIFHVTVGVTP